MALNVRSADLNAIADAQRVLLSPLGYPTLDAWRDAVTLVMKDLMGADLSSFAMRSPNTVYLYNRDFDLGFLRTYLDSIRTLDPKLDIQRIATRHVVWSRRLLWVGRESEYYRSGYYNDFIVPSRGYDAVGVCVQLGDERTDSPQLLFHHDRPTGGKFGRRGADLLRLLYPAFDAGVNAYLKFHERRKTLLSGIDELDEGILLFDRSGAVAHQNAAATNLLQQDAQREKLLAAARDLANTLLIGPSARKHGDSPVPRAVMPLTTSRHSYRLRACLLEASLFGDNTPVMVFLRKEGRHLSTEADLQARFRLTEREASVALLLADRHSNDEIAATLGISSHTAHHHTERVLSKLGVSSRSRVRKRLQRGS